MDVTVVDFVGTATSLGFVEKSTSQLSTTALIGILAGIVGITIGFTLIYRFARSYPEIQFTGAMTKQQTQEDTKERRK